MLVSAFLDVTSVSFTLIPLIWAAFSGVKYSKKPAPMGMNTGTQNDLVSRIAATTPGSSFGRWFVGWFFVRTALLKLISSTRNFSPIGSHAISWDPRGRGAKGLACTKPSEFFMISKHMMKTRRLSASRTGSLPELSNYWMFIKLPNVILLRRRWRPCMDFR